MRIVSARVAVVALLLFAGACGDDSDDAAPPSEDETVDETAAEDEADSTASDTASDDETSDAPATDDTASTEPDPEEPAGGLRPTLAGRGVAELVLEPTTEAGPHPTLSWQVVDGAATYWLVLLDAAGDPYWAWTGPGTTVRVGGGDTPEENQTAALHEAMTWTVSAFDADGVLLAISEAATVSP